ncbi:ATP-binding cassette domain-containing protein [bacterium]|nr:ATP-binding cassette domain-containing protein [bacterium]
MPKVHVGTVRKFFGSRLAVKLDDRSFVAGELTLLQGTNGSGKTSLLRILGGVLSAEVEEIEYTAIAQRSLYEPRFLQFPSLTVQEHLFFLERMANTTLDRSAIDSFGLPSIFQERVHTLSKGWRAKLGLAMAFARSPQLLLLDEPLDGLDTPGKHALLAVLEEQLSAAQCVVIIATHRPEEFPFSGQQKILLNHHGETMEAEKA